MQDPMHRSSGRVLGERLPVPTSLSERLARDLGAIARAIEHVRGFPAVSPGGWIGLGCLALALGPVAARSETAERVLVVWLGVAVLAGLLGGLATLRRARAERFALFHSSLRDFWSLLLLPFGVGAALTGVFWDRSEPELLPGTWLVCYGLGIAASATWCRSAVRRAGFLFVGLGLVAFARPELGQLLLIAGFGGIHLVTGLAMAWHDARRGTPSAVRDA